MKNAATMFTLAAAVLAAGCSAARDSRTIEVAETLRPSAGQVMALELLASGVQLYECTPSAAKAGQYEWKFRGPEAALADRGGASRGRHYGGPTWESNDGSMVVGEVLASAPSPDPSAIPHLLLKSRHTSGSGAFGRVRSIQRLATAGGRAPASACAASDVGRIARVPYTATYRFFEDAR
jgi:uncharacterized protein DUF3455